MTNEFSSWQDPPALINAIWAVRRSGDRNHMPEILSLLDHSDPVVREEALSLLFVKWEARQYHDRLVRMIRSDSDTGVRARAAGALALMSNETTRGEDIAILRDAVLDVHDDDNVRKASYEGLLEMIGRPGMLDDEVDLDEDVDLDWVRALSG
jgi:HEAT repeat protein